MTKTKNIQEFIENYCRIAPEGEHIELTPTQKDFIDWLVEQKK